MKINYSLNGAPFALAEDTASLEQTMKDAALGAVLRKICALQDADSKERIRITIEPSGPSICVGIAGPQSLVDAINQALLPS